MAITRPVTKTKISTVGWGIPITDEVNRLSALPVAPTPTAWTAFTFLNGWTGATGGYPIAGYRRIGDMVYMRGRISGGTMGQPMFNLPAGFRPPYLYTY